MTSLNLLENPFKVFTPEDMDAADVAELFVNPPDAAKLHGLGHTMLNGARGCGKSMIFRYLLADCQQIALDRTLDELPFLSFLVSIKNAGSTPKLTEFLGLQNRHANLVLNEHVLTTFVAAKVFTALGRMGLPDTRVAQEETRQYVNDRFCPSVEIAGGRAAAPTDVGSCTDLFVYMADVCNRQYSAVVRYVRRFVGEQVEPYKEALWDYLDFLFPLLTALKELSFLPSAAIYLLIDDADYLNEAQTMSLNSWISTRTQAEVSIKVSTQLAYKTLRTISGLPIQSPHDFQRVDISDLYTTGRGRYRIRVEEIIAKRLKKASISSTPKAFFPYDENQQKRIDQIASQIKKNWKNDGKGYRASDDVSRYARPEYIRSLGGAAKSMHTYSYSGFDQLAHISSGLVRYFLDSAARMFDEQRSRSPNRHVSYIEPNIQDDITRVCADEFALSEFDQIMADVETSDIQDSSPELDDVYTRMSKLRNLIRALGGAFFLKLISDDAERRVFSVAITGTPDAEVERIFDLGVQYGYFHKSTIGNKEGTGRTRLYILSRRLAPHFKLDPSSFAGYLWVTNDAMRNAMAHPGAVLRRWGRDGISRSFEDSQLNLFED